MTEPTKTELQEAAAVMGRVGGRKCVAKGFAKSGKASACGRKGGSVRGCKKGFAKMTAEERAEFYARRSAARKSAKSATGENA